MRKPATTLLAVMLFAIPSATALAKAAQSPSVAGQTDCSALNRLSGEAKFTGQISNTPDGSTMQVSYGSDLVVVRRRGTIRVR